MIQVHTDELQTVIPLLIRGVTLILHTFSILSAPSMIEFFKTFINCLNRRSRLIRGVTLILHTFSILSAPSMIEFFKTFINCLNRRSRWYRFIQAGCRQLSPWFSGVSHQYCSNFQFYHCHLWMNLLKLW